MALTPASYMPPNYWARRAGMSYYARVADVIEQHSPGIALLDVGAADTPVVMLGNFQRRYTCDMLPGPERPGVYAYVGDWLGWEPPELMSVVTCLQVLEHVKHPAAFGRKLLRAGLRVVVTVPYMWQRGREPSHIHDPIDMPQLVDWMGVAPLRSEIIGRAPFARLLAVFRGGA
jgi:hypothetical protein